MKKILIVVGTRPNFIKVTQFRKILQKKKGITVKFFHTGQHYDDRMTDVFFRQLHLSPDHFLKLKSSSPVLQIAEIMVGLENYIKEFLPDIVLTVGDVNSTLAAALTTNKMGLRQAHVESGLRSFDRSMPEEYNRIVVDHLADYLFVTEKSGVDNLLNEGRSAKDIFFVGNTMIDTMVSFDKQIKDDPILTKLGLKANSFVLMTLHRPENVDTEKGLVKFEKLVDSLKRYPIVFPVHPRTQKNMQQWNVWNEIIKKENLLISEPLDYFAFQKLISTCRFIITDSGGIQEESTYRRKSCITLRNNTERPSTVSIGTNTVVPFELGKIKELVNKIEKGSYKKGSIPAKWDGKATQRIVDILLKKI